MSSRLSPGEAIKTFCRICQGLGPGSSLDPIRDCRSEWNKSSDSIDKGQFPDGCPLWPFRLGKTRSRTLTKEQKDAAAARLHEHREKRVKQASLPTT